MATELETRPFQAETRQLLDIVIHSLYSNKEIFLRELISNASDALDRLRFEAISNPALTETDDIYEIRLETDPERRTLTVTDSGIGMSRDEVIANIGTIARSGTRELVDRLKSGESRDQMSGLIGQFGVGFYSAFMVADRVTLVTRRAESDTAARWESSGDGSYEIGDDSRFRRGTSVTLHLKPVDRENGIEDYTDFATLQRIVKRHSDFVAYPILATDTRPASERPSSDKTVVSSAGTVSETKTLNSMTPIWTRPASEVGDEEFAEFYRHIAHDWMAPLDRLALKAEGRLEYQSLLFIPSKAPFDLYYRDQTYGLQLYVRRVLIMDHCQALLPSYLRFVKGVVDSADLPLNISRELVQQDRHITQMRQWLTRKVLDHLLHLLGRDRDKYLGFWRECGPVLKEGLGIDSENRERLLPLLLCESSASPDALTTLAEYTTRMKPEQDAIYYLTGESRLIVEHSPHLEAFRSRGYEVLYFVDPVDELLTQTVTEFEGKPLKSVGKGHVDLGSEEERKQQQEELKDKSSAVSGLLSRLQKSLDEWVKEVRLSNRLTTSPACLVSSAEDLSPGLERMLRRAGGTALPAQKRILELNPKHELLDKLETRFSQQQDDALVDDYAHLLYGYALLAEGSAPPDPARFNRLFGELLTRSL